MEQTEHVQIFRARAKYRELIELAVAASIKCPYCQLFHRESAKMQGVQELQPNLSELDAYMHAHAHSKTIIRDVTRRKVKALCPRSP